MTDIDALVSKFCNRKTAESLYKFILEEEHWRELLDQLAPKPLSSEEFDLATAKLQQTYSALVRF